MWMNKIAATTPPLGATCPQNLVQVQCYRSGKRGQEMPRKQRYSTEQMITKLREADVLLSQGKKPEEIARAMEISKQTYYRW